MSGAFYLRSAIHKIHSFSLFNAKSLKFEKDVPDTLAYTKNDLGADSPYHYDIKVLTNLYR